MYIFDLIPDFRRYALHERGMKPRSFTNIKHLLSRLSGHLGNPTINQFTTDTIRGFLYDQKEQNGWSAKTFRNNRQMLSTFFNWTKSLNYTSTNPVLDIDNPKVPHSLPRFLTNDQIKKISSSFFDYPWTSPLQSIRNRLIFKMFLYTGLRLNELLNLKKIHVDMSSRQILVVNGKGQKDRTIPIHHILIPLLSNYLSTREKKLPDSPWLFTSLHSTAKMCSKDVYRFFKHISNHSGIKFTPHQLRHTFGKLAVESDMNIYKIQKIMGHSSISTTQIYLSTTTNSLRESIDDLSI